MKLPATPRFLRGAGAFLIFASLVCGQGSPDGHWEGTFTWANNSQARVSLDLAKNAKGQWIASMGFPSDNLTGLVVMEVAIDGESVRFVSVEMLMARFELKLRPNGQMTGTVSRPMGPMPGPVPVEFKRTGEAKVELIPPSPAVSKRLEGDWEGTLQMPQGALPMSFHFKNQPDKTVLATFDTPRTGGMRLPLNDVKEAGQTVEFGVKVARGTKFRGTLNEQETELTGHWSHEENRLPLTLRKK